MIDNSQKNITNLMIWMIPIVIVAKIVRWTVMINQLVWMSMGWQMVNRMNTGDITPFHASLFSETTNQASTIMSNSEALFSAINIFGFTTYIEWEWFFSIVFNIIMFFLIRRFYLNNPQAGTRENIFIYLNIAIINVFCLNMSKEPLQLITFLLMAWALIEAKGYRQKCIWLVVVLVLSVMYCRKYYALVIMYFFVLQFFVQRWFEDIDMESQAGKNKLYIRLAMMAVVFGLFHFFFLSYMADNNEESYEEIVSANTRENTGAVSEITPLFPGGNRVMLAVDYFIKIFRLMFPVELIFKGKFTYVFLIVYQALLATFLVRAFKKRGELTEEEYYEEEEDDDQEYYEEDTEVDDVTGVDYIAQTSSGDEYNEEDDIDIEEEELDVALETQDHKDMRTAALFLYIAFLLCSAAFEPDFGSWVRHEGVAFPIILLIL